MAHQGVEPRFGQAGAQGDIVRKAGMPGGAEGQATRQTAPAHGDAERPFGGNMDRIRRGTVEKTVDRATRGNGEADFRIARTGHRKAALRGQQGGLVSAPGELAAKRVERAHDTVDLRVPGVADESDFHAAASTLECCSSRAAISAAQWRISMRPSACSTSAVQLSTQSPSFR